MYKKGKKEDYYTRLAREEGYPARSVYKLKEIDEKYKIFKQGDRILDLGCAPGSWVKYIHQVIGEKGRIIGIDELEIKFQQPDNVILIKENILKLKIENFKEFLKKFDVVVSDLAPKTSGIKTADVVNSFLLAEKAFLIAKDILGPNGKFICKIFEGELSNELFKEIEKYFNFVKRFRPKAVLKESKEIYIIALGFVDIKSP